MKITNKKAKAIIINNGKILMLKKANKDFKFSLPGGNIKKKETKKNGLIREIHEELGVGINKSSLQYIIGYTIHTPLFDESVHFYQLTEFENNFKVGEPEKFECICWVDIKVVLSLINRKDSIVLKKFLEEHKRVVI